MGTKVSKKARPRLQRLCRGGSAGLLGALKAGRRTARLDRPAMQDPVEDADHHAAADDIAQGHRNEVVHQEIRPGEVGEFSGREIGPDEDAHRDHEHVRDRVLESRGDEQRDGQHQREDLVGAGAPRVRHPHTEADEQVAPDAEGERLDEGVLQLVVGGRENDLPPAAVGAVVHPAEVDECHDGGRPDGVADVDQRPVCEQAPPGQATRRLADEGHRRGGEQVGSGDHAGDQPQREHEAADELGHAPGHGSRAHLGGGVKDEPEKSLPAYPLNISKITKNKKITIFIN